MLLVSFSGDSESRFFDVPAYFKRHNNFFCLTVEARTNIGNRHEKQFFVALFQLPFVFIGETLVDHSLAHVNVIDVNILFVVIIYNRKHIYIVNGMADNFALGNEVL